MSDRSEELGILHLLLSSEESAWRDCLRSCKATDTVVLLDAGVMGLAKSYEDFHCTLVAAESDVIARLGTVRNAVSLISDDDLVGLIERYPHCLSWR